MKTAFSVFVDVPHALAAQEAASPQAQAWIDIATFSGMGMPERSGAANEAGDVRADRNKARNEETQAAPKMPQPLEVLKGIFGR